MARLSSSDMGWLPISIQRTRSPTGARMSRLRKATRHSEGTAETALISPASSMARISRGSNPRSGT